MKPSIKNNTVLNNLYKRQIDVINKAIGTLHEDLQYDYTVELDKIKLWD